MNDRYIFRAKRIDNGEWVEGDLSNCIVVGKTHICKIEDNLSTTFHEVDPSTLCQCVGLRDKNSELIWENDIVTVPDDEEPCVIEWDENCARWNMSRCGSVMCDFDNYWGREIEKIGNIFDTPELCFVWKG